MNSPLDDLKSLGRYVITYQSKKTRAFGRLIEHFKDSVVEVLMLKRGRLQKRVWHLSMGVLALIGILTSGVMGGNSIVASTLPGLGIDDPRSIQTYDPLAAGANQNFLVKLRTSVSQKPRSETIDYQVKGGDTLSSIAQDKGVSVDTIKWANNLTSDVVKPGDTLKILPVSGVSVTVKAGDTLESLAKKYQADSQAILDFPFNDVPDDFKLQAGQTLVIPDGTPPEVAAPPKPKITSPQFLAQGTSPTFSAPAGGNFIWPTVAQGISTYFAWWHPGIDLPNRSAPPIQAAAGGVITYAGWDNTGYGNRVDIDHGNGYTTRYAHMSNIYVGDGQRVSVGQVIGQMGSTGRSTGTHLHFEIHFNGIAINPLAILH